MPERYDVVVVGLGAAGASAVLHLADRGLRVLGLDRFHPPHDQGSTHGESRMIREAYFEHPLYVPLVQRAYEGWEALEDRAGRTLLHRTGGIMIGPPDGELVRGSRESARRHGLPYEELSAAEVRTRFPALRPGAGMVGILEGRAGILDPEGCVEAFLAEATRAGAELLYGTAVTGWRPVRGGFAVRSPGGEARASRLLLTAGPWTADLVPDLHLPLEVERMVQYWFEPAGRDEELEPGRCPVYAWEDPPAPFWYGFPTREGAVKVGFHYGGERCHPDRVRREVAPSEVEAMRDVLRRYMPAAAGRLRRASTCLYTNTPDHHFLVDFHPDHPGVLIASACSGHGFKFATVLGEILADLLTDGEAAFDLAPFRLGRFEGR